MTRLFFMIPAVGLTLAAAIACQRVPTGGGTAAKKAPTGPAPQLVFAKQSHDFGTVAAGAQLEHVFVFKNEGQGELRLQQPRGS